MTARLRSVGRALSAVGRGTVYSLGSGAPPTALWPAGEDGACDCSGFVAWAFGYSRYQPLFGWLVRLNGGWMSTEGIYEDMAHQTGLWSPADGPEIGAAVVYPPSSYASRRGIRLAKSGPRVGHVGIVTRLLDGGQYRVIHCSAGNWRAAADAIQETGCEVFERVPYRRFARFADIDV